MLVALSRGTFDNIVHEVQRVHEVQYRLNDRKDWWMEYDKLIQEIPDPFERHKIDKFLAAVSLNTEILSSRVYPR